MIMTKSFYSVLFKYRNGFIILSALLLFGKVEAYSQSVTYDAISTSQGTTGFGPATATWSHVCTGTNLVLVVSIAQDKGFAGTNEITGITYGGVSLTKEVQTSNGNFEAELWYLIAPTIGTNDVVITSTSASMQYVGTSVSFTNAHQTASSLIGGSSGGVGLSASSSGAVASVPSVAATDMLINSLVYKGFSTSLVISGTLDARNIAQASFGQIWGGCQTKQGSGAAIASQYDWNDLVANEWAVSSLVLRSSGSCTVPTVQSSGISFNAQTATTMDLSWVRGDGNKVLVVCKTDSVPMDPVNGISYTANSIFSSGDDVGSSSYVVYDGVGTNVSVTGLVAGTDYYFEIWEYNSAGACYNTNSEEGNHSTDCTVPITQASDLSFDAETSTTIDISWVRGDGNKVLVICKTGAAPSDPTSGTSYTADAVFGSGDDVGSNSYAVYDGIGTSVSVTGLTAATDYYFEIWEYNSTGICYRTISEDGNHLTGSALSNDEISKEKGFSVFPNPANEEFMYSYSGFEESVQIEVFSTSGQLVKRETIVALDGSFQGFVRLSDVVKGLYIVRISDGKNSSQLKLAKQ